MCAIIESSKKRERDMDEKEQGMGRRRQQKYSSHDYVRFVRDRMWLLQLSSADVSRHSGVSEPQLSFVISGKQNPETISLPTHQGLSIALKVSLRKLVELAGYDLDQFEDQDMKDVNDRIRTAMGKNANT